MSTRQTVAVVGAVAGAVALWLAGMWLGIPAMNESGHYAGPAKWFILATGGVSVLYFVVGGSMHLAATVRRRRLLREYHQRQRS